MNAALLMQSKGGNLKITENHRKPPKTTENHRKDVV
jgi:hypothetical protein